MIDASVVISKDEETVEEMIFLHPLDDIIDDAMLLADNCRTPWTCKIPRDEDEIGKKKYSKRNPYFTKISTCLEYEKLWFSVHRSFQDNVLNVIYSSNATILNGQPHVGYCEKYRNNSVILPKKEKMDLNLNVSHITLISNASSPTVPSYENRQLREKMQNVLKRLPPPTWPQLNHGTAMAIANGVILGPTCTWKLTTIGSKHRVNEYVNWFPRLLETSDPMIIFVEPNSTWFDFAYQRRQHAPTILIARKFSDLVMSTTFSVGFWNEVHNIDRESHLHSINLYRIWNEKLILMSAAIEMNPFKSTQFLWADAGYFRQQKSSPNKPIVIFNITNVGVHPSKVLFLHILNPTSDNPIVAAGNMFIGTQDAFSKFYHYYYRTFWFLVKNRISVGSDQHVMCFTCYYFRDACQFFYPGVFKRWFALSVLFIQNRQMATRRILYHNESWISILESVSEPPAMDTTHFVPKGVVSECPKS